MRNSIAGTAIKFTGPIHLALLHICLEQIDTNRLKLKDSRHAGIRIPLAVQARVYSKFESTDCITLLEI